MADYTWIKGLLTLGGAPNISTFNNLGLNVVLPFKGGVAQPLGLGGAKMIPNGSRGAWGEEAKYNVMAYFMEDEPELKNISPDEIIRRINLCRSQTSLPITCIFTGYFYRETPNNWNTRYAEVIRKLDFVCVDVYFYRYGALHQGCLDNAKKSIEIIQGLGKPIVGVAQGHEEDHYNTTRPDIPYVDNFWRSRGCGRIWYAWNVGEGSIGSRGGLDDWYNEQIRIVNEVEAPPPPVFTCPQCGVTFGSQAELDDHIASEHPSPPPPAGWISPTGYEDPDNQWGNEPNVYDGDLATYTRSEPIATKSWGRFLNVTVPAIQCGKVRFYAQQHEQYNCQIDLDVYRDGAWLDVYQGAFATDTWVEKAFVAGSVTKARFRIYNCNSVYGTRGLFYEFQFESQEVITTKTLVHTCNAKVSYRVSSYFQNNYALSCPHCGLALEPEGIKGSEEIVDVPEVITPVIVTCSKCSSKLELSVSSVANKNIQQYCPVCGEAAD